MAAALSAFLASLPLPPVAPQTDPRLTASCPKCGSTGANVHQYTPRRVIDPRLSRVLVTRLTCKVCGYVRRQYPAGVGSGRLSLAMVQICRLLRACGLPYASMRAVLMGLGCAVSVGALHRAAEAETEPPSGRLRLKPDPIDPTCLCGPDGRMAFRWRTCSDRLHLEIQIAAGQEAAALRWRLERAIEACWIHTET